MKVLQMLAVDVPLMWLGLTMLPAADPMPDLIALRWASAIDGQSIDDLLERIDAIAGAGDRIESHLSGGRDLF